jgi:hypothetical protein
MVPRFERSNEKPQVKLAEKHCAACNGTGHLAMVSTPKKPTVRTYPPQCGVCLGKGRVASGGSSPSEAALLFLLARLNVTATQTFVDHFAAGRCSEHVHSALRTSWPAWIFGHAAEIQIAF